MPDERVCVPLRLRWSAIQQTMARRREYDAANGAGAFMKLAIPNPPDRVTNFDAYLPASPNHPNATESFRHAAVAGSPQFADLGLWNVYRNRDLPNPQVNIASVICAKIQNCTVDQGMPTTTARFRTPMLRDEEDSQPYFHTGSEAKFNDVVEFSIKPATRRLGPRSNRSDYVLQIHEKGAACCAPSFFMARSSWLSFSRVSSDRLCLCGGCWCGLAAIWSCLSRVRLGRATS